MKKIMLVCAAGMSTSLLVTKMEKAAAAMGDEVEIFALPISELTDFQLWIVFYLAHKLDSKKILLKKLWKLLV